MIDLSRTKIRYSSVFKKVSNWPDYLYRKITGFGDGFDFKIRAFETIPVPKKMLGVFRENFFDEVYFRFVPDAIFQHTPSPVILDIGGNVGFFSLSAFARFPNAKIHAFETHPFCYSTMENYRKRYPRLDWQVHQVALSGSEGTITLNTSTLDGFSSMSSVFKVAEQQVNEFSVPTLSLQALMDQKELDRIDFIKFDCEGSEYDILYALPKDYVDRIQSMCIETHKGSNEDQHIDALISYLDQFNFDMHVQYESAFTGYIWAWKKSYTVKKS